MADSLVLKGVKDVRKHTGTEMQLVIPRRGGNTHQIRQWWRNGVNTPYCACTLFRVTTAVGTVYLALETGSSERATVKITHDGSFNFTFSHLSQLKRAALYNESRQLIEHYAFPAIVNGPIVKVTPPGAADRPTAAPPPPTIGTVTLSGEQAPSNGATETYTANKSGDASPTYVLTSSNANDTVSNLNVTYSGTGPRTLTVTATDVTASDNPATGTLAINVAESFADRVAGADVSVFVTVADTGSGDKYQIDDVEQAEITANATETIHFDLSDASLSGHPLKIYTDDTKITEVTVGIEQEGTDLLFTPPIAGSFSYQCANHAAMGGDITVSA